ncbi:Ferritin-related [Plasmopara halstedii]|uniref:Ferritin-related n=1 Tax=Plasmopara halstedii TaxID=4781 RepID=A0A0P1AR99_PLAHL|nr:Ferritin-related [Plasmopara halstedii]CEG43800.1 Ferritin-related [Plasmopara halstedii]|eukprot:XP_024580169.1 Ferritin-related [Plasmopara halstedii]
MYLPVHRTAPSRFSGLKIPNSNVISPIVSSELPSMPTNVACITSDAMSAAEMHSKTSETQDAKVSASIDNEVVEKKAADQLLLDTNELLSNLGFGDRAFSHVADLVASVSSMSVALYEKLFQFRLRDVERIPRTRQDYEHNAQVVANALQSALLEQGNDGDVLDELTGEKLCAGDFGSIRRLLTMLEQVYTLLFEESEEVGERLRDLSLASLGMAAKTSSKRRIPPKLARKQRKESVSKNDDSNSTQVKEMRDNSDNSMRGKDTQLGSQKHEEVRTGCAVSGRRKSQTEGGSRAGAIAENNKKRSRLLKQSCNVSTSSKILANNTTISRTKLHDLSRVSNRRWRRHRSNEKEFLATKEYGRFVTAASDTSSDCEKPCVKKISIDDSKKEFFESVSSVQHNSDESIHFMDDEGVLAQEFSSIGIDDAEVEQEDGKNRNESVSDRENTIPNKNSEAVTHQKKTNQQEAQEDDDLTSPVKKKVVPGESSAPEQMFISHTKRQKDLKSLHPMLPKTKKRAEKSKAQVQYLRYKLTLKNHLQELRQREMSQRQHMERAFKSGEHLATVDKIRSRRFEQDVRLHRIAIGLEAKNEEEKQLRQTMNYLLGLEKEKLREEHRLTTSLLKQIQKEHMEREQAMENYYANQIQLVKERTLREVKERELVEKAQRSASEKMMRELRHEKENELAALLQKKQHLEKTRQFRQASQLAQLLEKSEEHSIKRTDAFYTAAMKARERRERIKQLQTRRTSLDSHRSGVKKKNSSFSSSFVR